MLPRLRAALAALVCLTSLLRVEGSYQLTAEPSAALAEHLAAPWLDAAAMLPSWGFRGCARAAEPPAGAEQMRLFVGVGAMKAGTTSLYAFLKALGEAEPGMVCLPRRKELNTWFYSRAYRRAGAEDVAAYWGEFNTSSPECGQLAVDVSPQYMTVPYAALRLCELAPPGETSLTALLRHPMDRLLSHFAHMDGEKHERIFRWQCKVEETLKRCDAATLSGVTDFAKIYETIKLRRAGTPLPGAPGCEVVKCPLKRAGVLERHLRREIAALRACHRPEMFEPWHAHVVNPDYRACLSAAGWERDGVPPAASPFHAHTALRPNFWRFHPDPADPALLVDWQLVGRGLYHEQLAWLFRFHEPHRVSVYCSEDFYRDMPSLVGASVGAALPGAGGVVAAAGLAPLQARPRGADVDTKPKLSPEAVALVEEYYQEAGLLRGLHLLFGGPRPSGTASFGQGWADTCETIYAHRRAATA